MQDYKLDIKGGQYGMFDVVRVVLMGLINKCVVDPLEYVCEQRMQRERYTIAINNNNNRSFVCFNSVVVSYPVLLL